MPTTEEETETPSVHTEPGFEDQRDAWGPNRVAANDPLVPAYRDWWRNNPLSNLRAGGKTNLWNRFQAEVVEGKTPLEAAQGPYTTTLEDLARPPFPKELDDVLASAPDLPSDEAWWGTPDPEVYAEGTIKLNKQQLAEELEKGNIVTLKKFREMMAKAEDWEVEVMRDLLSLHRLKQHMVPLGDGKEVSFWDLYKYVRCNPQLEALAKRGVNVVDAMPGMTREDRIRLLEEVAPWTLDPEADTMVLPPRVALSLPWGQIGEADYFSRRPTRWLKGLDGVKDFSYGAYLHEEATARTLGPRWGGRPADKVLSDPQYFDDLLAAGPLVGMTLLAVTSRPLPVDAATTNWRDTLSQQLDRLASSHGAGPSGAKGEAAVKPCCAGKANKGSSGSSSIVGSGAAGTAVIPRPVFGPLEVSKEKLGELVGLFDAERLKAGTALLDPEGRCLREGATVLFSAAPGGTIVVEAVSPGKVREQQRYLLGAVSDERLAAAVFGAFLHPERCIDPGFAHRAAYNSLWFVNGFKSYNADNNPHVRSGAQPAPRVPRLRRRGKGAQWELPAPGTDPTAAAPTLLRDVRRRVMYHQVHVAFTSAWAAANEVEQLPGMDERTYQHARRAAAEAALRRSLGGLGLNVQGLSLTPPEIEPDLAAFAQPLQVP